MAKRPMITSFRDGNVTMEVTRLPSRKLHFETVPGGSEKGWLDVRQLHVRLAEWLEENKPEGWDETFFRAPRRSDVQS